MCVHLFTITIKPGSCLPEVYGQYGLVQCPAGVVQLNHFTRNADVIRFLKEEEIESPRAAHAMIGLIKAVAGIA